MSGYAKMRVSDAAQFLPNSVHQLMIACGDEEMARSAWIAGLFNRWFDCMNATSRSSVAFCYVTMKPNGQKNDVRCEYTRGAPEPILLQIPIDI